MLKKTLVIAVIGTTLAAATLSAPASARPSDTASTAAMVRGSAARWVR
jgi:hypothetical protein